MTVSRNAPCPCGSGKKYKKCCLEKDTAAARAAEEQLQAERAAREAEWERMRKEQDALRVEDEPFETVEGSGASREPDWPPLSPDDQELVDAWWAEVHPVYTAKRGLEKSDWLLERVLAFLNSQPRLFRYLDLHEEFLFELEGALARAGHRPDHLALLRRLRREQPEMYLLCFGYHDMDLLAEALRTGQREEISELLELFRAHPIRHIDEFAKVVDLLAWRGCEPELRALLEPTAVTIAESSEVIDGDFGLLWLTEMTIFPFLEAADDSPAALDRLGETVGAVGLDDVTRADVREWLRRAVAMASPSAAPPNWDLAGTSDRRFQTDLSWHFTGWMRRTKGLTWIGARFLARALLDYLNWNSKEDRRKPATKSSRKGFPGLNETGLDSYLAQRCRDIICINGVSAMSTLQAFHGFTEYLAAHDALDASAAVELQSAVERLYALLLEAVDHLDVARSLCPNYAALIAMGSQNSSRTGPNSSTPTPPDTEQQDPQPNELFRQRHGLPPEQ